MKSKLPLQLLNDCCLYAIIAFAVEPWLFSFFLQHVASGKLHRTEKKISQRNGNFAFPHFFFFFLFHWWFCWCYETLWFCWWWWCCRYNLFHGSITASKCCCQKHIYMSHIGPKECFLRLLLLLLHLLRLLVYQRLAKPFRHCNATIDECSSSSSLKILHCSCSCALLLLCHHLVFS